MKKRGFVITIVILSLAALVLSGILISDRFFSEPEPSALLLTPDGIEPIESSTPAVNVTDIPYTSASPLPDDKVSTAEDFRAVWVSTVINLDWPSAPGLSAAAMKSEALDILDECAAMGFNAVIFQVRPSCDAMYKSEIYPWSEFLTGTQGTAPGFDPLEFWIAEAHARGIELHAWINPYRVARNSHDIDALSENSPARLNPDWVVKHSDGHMYLDPGLPEARAVVVDGVREIVENYDVDGIHFDDYFYPDGGIDDGDSYRKYGTGTPREDWRKGNVNTLIKEVGEVIDAAGDAVFGISPFGIWANISSNPLGSATNGNQSLYSHYADTRAWVKEGLIDYICPQLYWAIGFTAADYSVLADWWAEVVRGTDVKLYIGHAAYRCGADDKNNAWYGTDELRRQLELNEKIPEISGSVQFRYLFFKTYPPLAQLMREIYMGVPAEPEIPETPLELPDDYPSMPDISNDGGISVGRPANDITTGFSKYYVLGRCNPDEPLYLNGEVVENVTDSGYFGKMVQLSSGANTLKFTQGANIFTRVITRGSSPTVATPLEKAEIISAYPYANDIYIQSGETITFRCTAPIGATVTVTIAGKTLNLTPAATKLPMSDGKPYGTNFSVSYTLPSDFSAGRIHTVGRAIYTMKYNGETSTVSAGGLLKCIGKGAPFYATVVSDGAFIYPKSSTSGGPVGELSPGMTDYITGITSDGAWIRLGMGYWVQRFDVDRIHGTESLRAGLSTASYTIGETHDRLSITADKMTVSTVNYDGSSVTLAVRYAESAPALNLPDGSMFSACSQWNENGVTYYKVTLRADGILDGWWLESDGDSIDLVLKRRPVAKDGSKPLDGLVIFVDPGHGGVELGAVGPLGNEVSERVLALSIAEKIRYELEARGAVVVMSRTDDSTVELTDRLVVARALKPDLILSVHLNAMEVDVDATNIHGVSTWFREDLSAEYSRVLTDAVSLKFGIANRGANQSNLYICRGSFCPSTILECGFICCPNEFDWLSDNQKQAEFAKSAADGVVKYFS